ncbi:MAG: hypothetical protein JF615_03910 [Asticcacaulis sp.]|nr:hypothetical protein [Asticcacaulis sp.]
MRKLIIGILAVTVLVGVIYTGYCAWIAYGTPARRFSRLNTDYAPECKKIPVKSNAFRGSPWACQRYLDEAVLLKQHPGFAVRDGDSLTILRDGKPALRLLAVNPSTGEDDCNAYDIGKVLSVYEPATAKRSELPLISCHQGEFAYRFLASPDGIRWRVPSAEASPDGRRLAVGDNRWDAEGGQTRLTLYDWPSRKVVARFRPSCRALTWQDDTRLTATCVQDLALDHPNQRLIVSAIAFDAKVWKDERGKWQMQATRWLRGLPVITRDGDQEFHPVFSLRPLPHFTAVS